jgi:hypothetical protein
MKGKILGFDAAGGSGAITGEDGQRYSFAAAEWKSGTAPSPGADVDFVTEGSAAKDIYPIAAASRSGTGNARQASAPGPDLSEGLNNLKNALSNAAEGDMAKKSLTVAHQRPQIVLAVIMLFASVFLTCSHAPFPPTAPHGVSADASLITFPSQARRIKAFAAGILSRSDPASDPSAAGALLGSNTVLMVKLQSIRGDFREASRLLSLAYLAWLIPAGAVFLLYREFTNTRNQIIEMAVGGIALGFTIICYLSISSLVSGFSGFIDFGRLAGEAPDASFDIIKDQLSFGSGNWVIAATGIGLILTGLGIVRETPGLANLAAGGNAGAA